MKNEGREKGERESVKGKEEGKKWGTIKGMKAIDSYLVVYIT